LSRPTPLSSTAASIQSSTSIQKENKGFFANISFGAAESNAPKRIKLPEKPKALIPGPALDNRVRRQVDPSALAFASVPAFQIPKNLKK